SAPAPAPSAAPPSVVFSRGVNDPPAQLVNRRARAKYKPGAVADVLTVPYILTSVIGRALWSGKILQPPYQCSLPHDAPVRLRNALRYGSVIEVMLSSRCHGMNS